MSRIQEPVTSSVSGLLRGQAHVRQARSRCLLCCPGVTVVTLGRPPHRARGGHGPLRPELAAPLGVWPSSQLAWCAGGRRGTLLYFRALLRLPSSARAPGVVLTRRPSANGRTHPTLGRDGVSVMRFRRSLLVTVGRCRCCHPRDASAPGHLPDCCGPGAPLPPSE
jgi:hypothetical protein